MQDSKIDVKFILFSVIGKLFSIRKIIDKYILFLIIMSYYQIMLDIYYLYILMIIIIGITYSFNKIIHIDKLSNI